MAITLIRERETASNTRRTFPYIAVNLDGTPLERQASVDAAVADATALVASPPTDYSFRRLSPHSARVEVIFSEIEVSTPAAPPVGEVTLDYRFNFQARSKYVFHALDCIGVYDSQGVITRQFEKMKLLVNVQEVGQSLRLVGMQVDPAPEVFTLDHTVPNGTITGAYQNTVSGLCGAWNSARFRDYNAGQIQLVRVSGAKRTTMDWQLSFGFGYEKNRSQHAAGGGITIPSFPGHAILWSTTETIKNAAGVLEVSPLNTFVQQVWDLADLNTLGLPP